MMKSLITVVIFSGVLLVISLSVLRGDGAKPLLPESPVVVGSSTIRSLVLCSPTPTPAAEKTPGLTPTSTPKMVSSAWLPPEELFAAFGHIDPLPGKQVGSQGRPPCQGPLGHRRFTVMLKSGHHREVVVPVTVGHAYADMVAAG